ncbi:MAG: 16S rRNA (guanine(527)-N(7))-methyltransferase RsmG [Coriobacteriia bacterium]|nr:16S rRNA (guanine(527)-N(7))-methyltransferase RsmG [Coriobacteriia bacterium]
MNKERFCKRHLELVIQANKNVNLTNITSFKEAEILHIEDSLASLEDINKQPKGEVLDIGSGAGYPGIPLAIYTQRNITLCETVQKKAKCLESFISDLELNSLISVFNGRAEETPLNQYQIVTARAVSSLNSLLELASPHLKIEGVLIAYKSLRCDDEIKASKNILNKIGMEFLYKRDFKLSNNADRRLVVYKKIKDPIIKLPRKLGFAQKKPLK